MTSYLIDQFNYLSLQDKDTLLEFLSNLTEGDLLRVARETSMDSQDRRALIEAFRRFQGDEEVPT